MKRAVIIMNGVLCAGLLCLAVALATGVGPLILLPPIPFIVTLLAFRPGLGKWLIFCAVGLNLLLLTFGVFDLVTGVTGYFVATWREIIISLGICLVPTINIVALAGTLRASRSDIAQS